MLKNRKGEDVELTKVLSYLQGTDDMDEAVSVMDFAVYPIKDEDIGDPKYYLIGTDVIVTMVAFIGPFISVELDFRNAGAELMQQVMTTISRFHQEVNTGNVIMLSTITPLSQEAEHTLSLANPLLCLRGFSEEGRGTSILQLIYSADNAAFSLYEIDYEALQAEVDREVKEIESYNVTNEALEAAASAMEDEEHNAEMKAMFKPTFGLDAPGEKEKAEKNVRIERNKEAARAITRKNERIGLTEDEEDDRVLGHREDN